MHGKQSNSEQSFWARRSCAVPEKGGSGVHLQKMWQNQEVRRRKSVFTLDKDSRYL
jgi:hypothetical protein